MFHVCSDVSDDSEKDWLPVYEGSCCLTELADERRLFLREDLWLGGQWGLWGLRGGRPGKLTLLFVLPGLQGAFKCLKHTQRYMLNIL